jgi:hypothetical protein
LLAALRTAIEFLANALGPAAKRSWPVSGIFVVAVTGYGVWQLARVFRHRPEERIRAAGLLAFLVAMGLLAASIGWGRAFIGAGAGMADRYTTLAAPLLLVWYFLAILYAAPRWSAHLQRGLLVLMAVVVAVSIHKEYNGAVDLRTPTVHLAADIRAGLAAPAAALRHGDRLAFWWPTEQFSRYLEILADARLGPYHDRAEHGPLEGLVVFRLVELAQPGQEPHTLRVTAEKPFQQGFSTAVAGSLERIDVQLSRWNRLKSCPMVAWELRRLGAAGRATVCAAGTIAACTLVHDDFAVLNFPAVAAARERFELVLSVRDGASDGKGVDVPLFDSTQGGAMAAKAFLFVRPISPR